MTNGGRDNEIRVSSWGELHDVLYEGSWREPLKRFRSAFAYRGNFDARDDLSTSLMRLGGPYARNEQHLLRAFRKYAGTTQLPDDSTWNWLALAQHHGLPTRLLDFTYSPYVAMHFATHDVGAPQPLRDGVIWCVDYVGAHTLLPGRLKTILKREGADVFTGHMLSGAAPELAGLAKLRGRGAREFSVFLEPPSLDARIVNQFALFGLMSSPTVSLLDFLKHHPKLFRRIVIPAKLKWEVRDKLDQANVTERVLFPGLDGLTRWLRRYYAPHPEMRGENRAADEVAGIHHGGTEARRPGRRITAPGRSRRGAGE